MHADLIAVPAETLTTTKAKPKPRRSLGGSLFLLAATALFVALFGVAALLGHLAAAAIR